MVLLPHLPPRRSRSSELLLESGVGDPISRPRPQRRIQIPMDLLDRGAGGEQFRLAHHLRAGDMVRRPLSGARVGE